MPHNISSSKFLDACENVSQLTDASLLKKLTRMGKKIGDSSRSINYLLNQLRHSYADFYAAKDVWHAYKGACQLKKADIISRTLLVQAAILGDTKKSVPSRVYYINRAHIHALEAGQVNSRFYINLVHSLFVCGPAYLGDAYDIIEHPELGITAEFKHRAKKMLDDAVYEYQTYGLRENRDYPDDFWGSDQKTIQRPVDNDVVSELLSQMADDTMAGVRDSNYVLSDSDKNSLLTVKNEIRLFYQKEEEIKAVEALRKIDGLNDWEKLMLEIEAIKQRPSSSAVYNECISIASKHEKYAYAMLQYEQAVTHGLANNETHTLALPLFAKIQVGFDWAWHAYSEIKRSKALTLDHCILMLNIALAHNRILSVGKVIDDAVDNKYLLPMDILQKIEKAMPVNPQKAVAVQRPQPLFQSQTGKYYSLFPVRNPAANVASPQSELALNRPVR